MRRAIFMKMLAIAGLWAGSLAAQPTAAQPVGPPLAERPLLRIGLIADAQYCDCDADRNRYYRISREKLQQAVATLNAEDVDMVVNLGDLIDRRLENYPVPLAALAQLEMPLYHVLGNHEFWDVPYHVQQGILDSLGMSQGYCDLEMPGWRLLFLDGTELAEYAQGAHVEVRLESELCLGSLKGHANGAGWNGAIGQAQMAWLDWQLADAAAKGQRALLFCHFPISPEGHPMTLWNDADLRQLLTRHAAPEAWIAGHSHTGDYALLDSVHHLTLQGMLMTPDSNAFAILNLYPDRLVVEGFGREPYRVLPLRGMPSDLADTLIPPPTPRPDALPPKAPTCLERTVVDWQGEPIFSAELDSLQADFWPRLRPGCYGVRELHEGKYSFSHRVVLPR